MIKLIKKWQEKRRRKRILKIIKDAKQNLLDGKNNFMCMCFGAVYSKFGLWTNLTKNIQEMIPEFNRTTLGATTPKDMSAWWNYTDRESRIKAFDKLIEIYS